ncbi:MAG: PIN domain-containing protein [Verrucomicrobiae bacterium]|nr:PIN domain-containing protein [Verrucomicrobiae bacterium]
MRFIDTNVLLYAFAGDSDASGRPEKARAVLAEGDIAFSVQVFQEFFVQATHSRRNDPLTHSEAREAIEALRAFPVQDNTVDIFFQALDIRARFRISLWDANILAAARALGCASVLSEDLNPGQDYGGVTVRNPFR